MGRGGDAISRLSKASRAAIEDFLERPVYLEMVVKEAKGWRSDKAALTQYGYYDPL